MTKDLSPERILQLGFGFWGPKVFLSAIELGVFTRLARGPADLGTLTRELGLHSRAARDFLDALVSLGVLNRTNGLYANAPDCQHLLDRTKPSYIGGLLEMVNARLYRFWGNLTEALQTGLPQNESKSKSGASMFESLYSDPANLRLFVQGMTGISLETAQAIAKKFPWSNYKSFVDVGGAQGALPVQIAKEHLHLNGMVFDLPAVAPLFQEYVSSFGLQDRIRFQAGDFFAEPLPGADVIVMGHILHDWNLEQKKALVAKAFAALPPGGALIVYEALIDEACRHNAHRVH